MQAVECRAMEAPKDLISLTEAAKLLGKNHNKMTALLKAKELRAYTNPLDRRKKLVSKAEVLALKEPRAEAA